MTMAIKRNESGSPLNSKCNLCDDERHFNKFYQSYTLSIFPPRNGSLIKYIAMKSKTDRSRARAFLGIKTNIPFNTQRISGREHTAVQTVQIKSTIRHLT